jgi:hypothetical protein
MTSFNPKTSPRAHDIGQNPDINTANYSGDYMHTDDITAVGVSGTQTLTNKTLATNTASLMADYFDTAPGTICRKV